MPFTEEKNDLFEPFCREVRPQCYTDPVSRASPDGTGAVHKLEALQGGRSWLQLCLVEPTLQRHLVSCPPIRLDEASSKSHSSPQYPLQPRVPRKPMRSFNA